MTVVARAGRFIAATAFLLCTPALAQDGDEARRLALAKAIFAEAQAEQMIDQMMAQMGPMMSQMVEQSTGNELDADERALMEDLNAIVAEEMTAAMGPLISEMAPIYAEVFTVSELEGVLDFYRSSAGQAFVNKQGVLIEKSFQASSQWAATVMPQVMQRVQARIEQETGN